MMAPATRFAQLGVHRWIMKFPRSAGEHGRIVLNPDDAEIAGYARVGVDNDGTTPGCLIGPNKVCGRAFFDSGAAGLRVVRATNSAHGQMVHLPRSALERGRVRRAWR